MRKSRFSEEQIIGILKEHQAGIGAKELCRKPALAMAPSTSMDVSPFARFSLICSTARPQVANIYPASPFDGAPKWEFRVVSLNKWSASAGHYKSQVPHTPEFAGRFISLIFLQSLLRA